MTLAPIPAARAEGPFVLAVDVGSSSVRAMLYDGLARPVEGAGASLPYALRAGADGAAEDDPAAAVERVAACVDAALAAAGGLPIAAVAVDTLASSFVALDAAGAPLTPLITYADTRNADDAAALRARLDEAAAHQRTGCLLRTSYWPARLAWLRRTRPEIWAAAARFATLGELLELRLFGRARAGLSAASWTGLLDRRRLVWDAPLLGALELAPERLGPLADVDAPLAGLAAPFARRWPALREVPWLPAVGDGAAANIGSGAAGLGRIALTMGTTGAMRMVVRDVPEVPRGLWAYRVDREAALLGGATSEGGNLFAWLRRTLQLAGGAAVEAEVAALAPDGHGLTVLPFLAGERSPGYADDAAATIHGLRLSTTPAEIVRAGLEAVAYRFALIAAGLWPYADPGAQLIASGGALHASPAWAQIFADVLGRTVLLSAEPEAAARGAALLGLRAVGAIPSLDAIPGAVGLRYEPDPERGAIYAAAIARQRRLYGLLVAGQG